MTEPSFNELEIASDSVVMDAARGFAEVLAQTPQFKAYEEAAYRYRHDEIAQMRRQAYQQKQEALRMMLMLNAVSPQDGAALHRLHHEFATHPSVADYLEAQLALSALCQEVGGLLSDSIGLDYAAACGASCCG